MKQYVVEYSMSQKSFHIQSLDDSIAANSRRFWHKPSAMFDWVPIFVGTRRQCELMITQSERRLAREADSTAWIH
jgi:hypothetical protein